MVEFTRVSSMRLNILTGMYNIEFDKFFLIMKTEMMEDIILFLVGILTGV